MPQDHEKFKNMVTQFNAKDLVSFGNFILNKLETGEKKEFPDGKHLITDADIQNWKHSEEQRKNMRVRAKFSCHNIKEDTDDNLHEVYRKEIRMGAVYSEEGENADYSEATPFGELEIHIDGKTPAIDFFEEGQDYYLDFSRVPNK